MCRCHRTDEKETHKQIAGTPSQSNKGEQGMTSHELNEKLNTVGSKG